MRSAAGRLATRRAWLLCACLAAVFGAFVLVFGLLPYSTSVEKDFGQEYVLARAIRDGIDPYQPINALGERYVTSEGYFEKRHPTPHPPTVGLLVLPLSLMTYASAARAWLLIELVCLLACVLILVRKQPRPVALGLVVAPALIGWAPVTLELGLGQLTLPVLLALLCAEWALIAHHPRVGGTLIGTTLLLKPIAWPLLLFLAFRRAWPAVIAAALAVGVGASASVLAIGVDHSLDYLMRVLPTMSAVFQNEPTNMAPWTVGARLGTPWLGWLLALAAALVGCWWSLKHSLDAGLAMMTIACLLASPIMWYFYFTLALLPIGYLLGLARQGALRPVDAGVGMAGCVLLSVSQAQLTDVARVSSSAGVFLVPTLGLTLIGVALARASRLNSARG